MRGELYWYTCPQYGMVIDYFLLCTVMSSHQGVEIPGGQDPLMVGNPNGWSFKCEEPLWMQYDSMLPSWSSNWVPHNQSSIHSICKYLIFEPFCKKMNNIMLNLMFLFWFFLEINCFYAGPYLFHVWGWGGGGGGVGKDPHNFCWNNLNTPKVVLIY